MYTTLVINRPLFSSPPCDGDTGIDYPSRSLIQTLLLDEISGMMMTILVFNLLLVLVVNKIYNRIENK